LRWTRTFIPTMREVPAEADIPSHRLMLRAGLIRKVSAGAYTYLPLGLRSLRKAAAIVREEMDRAGALEVLMPAVQPVELWEQSGRIDDYGPDLMRLTDRHGRRMVLGPTHEELVTALVRDHVQSYRQLPLCLYQIQTKFRDEVRPRFGVLRSREFLMKDAYSFDRDEEGLGESYDKMYQAYCRVLERCGLGYVAVEADSGAIGGSVSHEFMVPSDSGEDVLVTCDSCSYAANLQRAEVGTWRTLGEPGEPRSIEKVATPGQTTIEDVSAFLQCAPQVMIKTLVYTAGGQPVAALVRGDHQINETKLARVLDVEELALADGETIEQATGAPVGFAGPVGLSIRTVVDAAVANLRDGVTGANEADAHLTGVCAGRDFAVEETADIRFAEAGDPCPRCSGGLKVSRGIEVGHVFKLGTKYSERLGAIYADEQGRERPVVMGCYGIGINRILAARIEACHDAHGIVWSPALAPYQVALLPLSVSDADVMAAAEALYADLTEAGVDVLMDDRDARPGVKFNDADLVGVPVRVVVGGRGLKEGVLEIKRRDADDIEKVPLADAVATLLDMVGQGAAADG